MCMQRVVIAAKQKLYLGAQRSYTMSKATYSASLAAYNVTKAQYAAVAASYKRVRCWSQIKFEYFKNFAHPIYVNVSTTKNIYYVVRSVFT